MKKKDLYALACALCFAGCNHPSADEVEIVKKVYPLQFSIQLEKEELPFPSTRSMPPNTIPEPTVPGQDHTDKELNDLCSGIEYMVFGQAENPALIKHRRFTPDMEDFGIIYDTLPPGNYLISFLAHQSATTTISGSTMTFDEVTDSFHCSQPVAVRADSNIPEDIILQRIVSRIEFCATDTVPAAIKQFDIGISNYAGKLNLLTGKGIIKDSEQTISHLFTPTETGKKEMCHTFFTFISAGNEKMSAHLSAIGMNNQLLRERIVPDIIPQANKIIRYTGRLYSKPSSDETFWLTVLGNGKWETTEEKELTD